MFERELARAHQLSRRGAYRDACDALERALPAAASDGERVTALTALAHILPRQGDLQAALRRASEAVALTRQMQTEPPTPAQRAAQAEALTELCYVYAQFLMGRDALQTGWQALAAAREAADPVREAWALNRLAVAYAAMDQTDQACQDTLQALEIAQARPQDDRELLLSCLNNLAHFWLQAHAEALRNGDGSAAAEALVQAGPYADRAATLVREEPNPFIIVVTLSNQVEHLLGSGETARARQLVEEYDGLARLHGYAGMERQARAQRALLGLRGSDEEASEAVTAILQLVAAEASPPLPARLRRQLCLALYRACKARGDYAKALTAHEQLSELERQSARTAMALQTEAMLIRQEFQQAQARAEHALQDARRERERAEHAEQEQHKLRRQAAELGRMAHEDALTALNNRRHAEFALPLLLERARQERKTMALALLDVDHFKRVNDTLGHGVGDQVLQQVAACLRRQLRSADLLARVGGEEFMLVFVGVKPAKALEICERLRTAIAAHAWHKLSPDLAVTVSLGLAAGDPPDRPQRLVETADQALYAAKHGGRNRVQAMEL